MGRAGRWLARLLGATRGAGREESAAALGALYAIECVVPELVGRSGRPPRAVRIGVLEAARSPGRTLADSLSRRDAEVLALAPGSLGGRRPEAGLLVSPFPADVRGVDLVLASGVSSASSWLYVPYAVPGQVWADGGDPVFPPAVVRALRVLGVELWRVALEVENDRSGWARERLRAAVVCELPGEPTLAELQRFSMVAREFGARGQLRCHAGREEAPPAVAFLRPSLVRRCAALFRGVDQDGDGRWSGAEIERALAASSFRDRQAASGWLQQADGNRDGQLDFAELLGAILVAPGSRGRPLAELALAMASGGDGIQPTSGAGSRPATRW